MHQEINKALIFCDIQDKGDGPDGENGVPEEDFLLQDEIYKSRLASIKRVSCSIYSVFNTSFYQFFSSAGLLNLTLMSVFSTDC